MTEAAEADARLNEARVTALHPTGMGRPIYVLVLLLCVVLMLVFLTALSFVFVKGIGMYGANIPLAWGFPLVNYGWWIGIGYSGLLLSALLLLTQRPWRSTIRRLSEIMALCGTAVAALFPILHLGRPWFFYYLMPYPSNIDLWPQWRSPLIWDFTAIASYIVFSLMFLYVGLIPEFAALRDRARLRGLQILWGLLALGWRGSALHWARFDTGYRILAALTVPLMLTAAGISGMDIASNIIPRYHSTLIPLLFVAMALYTGSALMAFMLVALRTAFRQSDLITERHLDNMGKLLLVLGWVVFYIHWMELFIAWYSGDRYERAGLQELMVGDFSSIYWSAIALTWLALQPLWLRSIRTRPLPLGLIAVAILVGLWLDHYELIFSGTHHGFIPSMWGTVTANGWDWALTAGSLGLFFLGILIFVRLFPLVSTYDVDRPKRKVEADG